MQLHVVNNLLIVISTIILLCKTFVVSKDNFKSLQISKFLVNLLIEETVNVSFFFFPPCQLDPLQTLVPSYVRHHNNQVKSDELDIMLQQSTLIFSNVACTR